MTEVVVKRKICRKDVAELYARNLELTRILEVIMDDVVKMHKDGNVITQIRINKLLEKLS